MRTTHAACFITLAEAGDPAQAAQRVGIAPQTLLHAVRRLEQAVDGRLFSSQPGAYRLTPLGRAWLPHLTRLAGGAAAPTLSHS